MTPLEIYVHIPFCARKCLYCDFLSFPAGRDLQERYLQALIGEIRAFSAAHAGRYRIRSVFFGGGTPSLLPAEQITAVMREICGGFLLSYLNAGSDHTDPSVEVTLEANPGTVTAGKLRAFREAGINRLSLGCQSMVDAELKTLGRIHSAEQFRESYALARAAGFPDISVDLMSGLPGQTEESWEYTLRAAAAAGPEHISAYSLILEEGTPFFDMYASGNAEAEKSLPDEETELRMYQMTEDILGEYGYLHYEISNYALPGHQSLHNTGYWTGVDYIGFGLGASSLLDGRRLKNTADMEEYLRDPAGAHFTEEILSETDRMAEFMILGLRMMAGVSEEDFFRRFGKPLDRIYGAVIRRHQDSGLLTRSDGHVRLTRRGIPLCNAVMRDFL